MIWGRGWKEQEGGEAGRCVDKGGDGDMFIILIVMLVSKMYTC